MLASAVAGQKRKEKKALKVAQVAKKKEDVAAKKKGSKIRRAKALSKKKAATNAKAYKVQAEIEKLVHQLANAKEKALVTYKWIVSYANIYSLAKEQLLDMAVKAQD